MLCSSAVLCLLEWKKTPVFKISKISKTIHPNSEKLPVKLFVGIRVQLYSHTKSFGAKSITKADFSQSTWVLNTDKHLLLLFTTYVRYKFDVSPKLINWPNFPKLKKSYFDFMKLLFPKRNKSEWKWLSKPETFWHLKFFKFLDSCTRPNLCKCGTSPSSWCLKYHSFLIT